MPLTHQQVTRDIRDALSEPRQVCEALGLLEGPRSFVRQHHGVIVRCPQHQDRTPSCSVRVGPDGTIAVKCHGCQASGDVFSLIAWVHGLDARRDFREVRAVAAGMAGISILPDAPVALPAPTQAPRTVPSRRADPTYPPSAEVEGLWGASSSVVDDAEAAEMLRSRGLDPSAVAERNLARVIPTAATLPRWARWSGQPWTLTGHRLLVGVYDAAGFMRSVRAWRVVEGAGPKRLPPGGHKAARLVLADAVGVALLAGATHKKVVICEGEPDFLTWATRVSDADENAPAVFGVGSGAWTDAHAARIPDGAKVVVRTHHDPAGDAYAAAIIRSLAGRCDVSRSRAPAELPRVA
jgi:hypothetical protein